MLSSTFQGWGADSIHTLHLKRSLHLLYACVLNCPQVSPLLVWERVCFCRDNVGSWYVQSSLSSESTARGSSPSVSQRMQTEEQGSQGDQKGPYLEVDAGGLGVAIMCPAGAAQLIQGDRLFLRNLHVIAYLETDPS